MRKMTADKKIGYALTLAILAAVLLVFFLPSDTTRWAAAAVCSIAAALTYAIVKKRSILSFHKREVLLLLTVIAVVYLVLYYLSGLFFGYAVAYRQLSATSFFTLIVPIALIVVSTEWLRSILLAQESKGFAVLTYVIGVASEVLIAGGIRGVDASYQLANLLGMTFFPAITANLLYTYLSKRYGMMPCTVYRLILSLYMYIIPVIPNAPQVLPAFAILVLPLIVYFFIDLLFEKKKKMATQKKSKWRHVVTAFLVATLALFVMLVSCQFRYGILVIGSPSMTGEINVGDAIVYEETKHCEPVKEQDVIVFLKDGQRVVHRVVSIQTVNGQIRYITKGDANEAPDLGYVTEDMIIGVVQFKILYVGYPSLWLKQIFR